LVLAGQFTVKFKVSIGQDHTIVQILYEFPSIFPHIGA
jgi:hypothetical protein